MADLRSAYKFRRKDKIRWNRGEGRLAVVNRSTAVGVLA